MDLKNRVRQLFIEKFDRAPNFIARAPGRVNLLGEHVDYNDGWVMPIAIDRATYVAFSPAASDQTVLWAGDFHQQVSFSPRTLSAKTQSDDSPLPDWAYYPAGVMWSLREAGYETPAMQAVFISDVPRGAGLSSSASVELAFGMAWTTLGNWKIKPMDLALLCQRAENEYVGVNCGIMDQFASACGERDRLLVLDCRSLEYRSLALPEDVMIVVADTSVRRKLRNSAYNDRRAACEEAVRILKQDLPRIESLRDVSAAQFEELSAKLPPEVERRARHVVEEMMRTGRAVSFLEKGDVASFGGLMNQCHASLRDLYEVSCPELDVMVRVAQSLEGCYGARLTGAGFGGCTVNLVARKKAEVFEKSLAARYESETGLHPEIYVCTSANGAGLV